jgi:WD40 repeat protein/serine/threonine protein kinase
MGIQGALMNHKPDQHAPAASPSGEYRVDQCSTEFEKAWKSGKREQIEDWLPRVSPSDQPRLLYELILVDVELRRAAGETLQADEYKQRFRDRSEIVDAAFAALSQQLEDGLFPATIIVEAAQDIGGGDLAIPARRDPEAIGCHSLVRPSEILGDFRLLRELGRGGMGVVWEAQQISLGRRVALKTLPGLDTIDSRSALRFQVEARAAALLDHQNIVRVHAIGFDRGRPYYAMQLVNGTDLAHVIRALRETVEKRPAAATSIAKNDTSPLEDTVTRSRNVRDLFGLSDSHTAPANQKYVMTFARLGIQAADALQHAHATGVVHRDIKPSNLLLDTDGNIRVTDFGLAQIQGETGLSRTGDIMGTLRYMSPEQAYAKRVVVDHRTDIYSLGATLYELLTLQRAFDGANEAELIRQIAFEDPTPPRQLNNRIPVELETIVMVAMSKSPDQRYQTAKELADDLRHFVNSEPIERRPPGPLDHARKWCNRHKPLVVSFAVVVSMFFIASVVSSGVVWIALRQTEAALQSEQDQRRETVRLWRKAEGLRLAALSVLVRPKDPGIALATAVEGHRLYPHRELNSALLSAYESNHEHRTLLGHKGAVGSVSFDREGGKLITTADRTGFDQAPEPARIWNVATGALLVELKPETNSLTSAVFSPGGVRILATSAPIPEEAAEVDGTDPRHQPTIWDSLTGRKLMTLADSYLFDAHPAAFDPAGQRVVTPAAGNTAKIWDVLDGRVLITLAGHAKRVIFAAFDTSGERVVTVSDDRTVRIWRARDGEILPQPPPWNQPGREPIFSAFSPDRTKVVTETTQDGIQLWNAATATKSIDELWPGTSPRFTPDGTRLVYTRYLNTLVRRVSDGQVLHEFSGALAALSPDGTLVATLAGTSLIIWNVASGEQIAHLAGHGNDILAATFDKSSKYLASASYDRTARLWNVKSGAERLAFESSSSADHPVAAENNGASRVAVATAPLFRTQLIDLEIDKEVVDVSGAVWNPDVRGGRLLTTEGNRAHVHDAETGERIAVFEEPQHAIFAAQLSYDGRRALIVADRGPTWLWQVDRNERVQLVGHVAAVLELDWSPNSEFVVTCSEDNTARIWDARTGMLKQTLPHPHPVVHVRVHPDNNRMATVMSNREGRLWDLSTVTTIAELRSVDGIPFGRVEFSASGDRIFGFFEERSQGVLCWNTQEGALVSSVSPVRGRVRIATSPVGAKVVIASSVDGAMIWDPAGDRQVLTDAVTAFAAFISEDRVVLATSGPSRDLEALRRDDRRKYIAPSLEVRNAGDGKLLKRLTTPIGGTIWLGVVPDSKRVLVSGAYYGISVYDAKSHHKVVSLRGHGAPLSFVGFAGNRVVTCSWDGTAAIWDGDFGVLRRRLSGGRPISAAALSSDGTRLALGDAVGNVQLWRIDEEQPPVDLKAHGDLVKAIAFKPNANDQLLSSSLDETTIVHQPDNAVRQIIETGGAVIGRIRPSEDGKRWILVPASIKLVQQAMAEPNKVQAGQAPRKLFQNILIHGDEAGLRSFDAKSVPLDAAFREKGRELVTIGARQIVVWDFDEARPLRELELAGETAMAGCVSPDGKLALTEHRDRVSLWDLDTGMEVMTIGLPTASETFRATHFDPASEHILTFVGGRLKSYPIHEHALFQDSPRRLTPAERQVYGVLDEKDWPRE